MIVLCRKLYSTSEVVVGFQNCSRAGSVDPEDDVSVLITQKFDLCVQDLASNSITGLATQTTELNRHNRRILLRPKDNLANSTAITSRLDRTQHPFNICSYL